MSTLNLKPLYTLKYLPNATFDYYSSPAVDLCIWGIYSIVLGSWIPTSQIFASKGYIAL